MAYVRASSHCAVGFDQVSYLSGYCQGRAWRAESRTKTPLSTPEQKCIGSPEQKYINDVGKKPPNWELFVIRSRTRSLHDVPHQSAGHPCRVWPAR
jgi:hypothetical protein